ncbi:MAG: heavy-metal-associated domain-containing protein [Alphaproteobacteria bacterium]|nr:heavy-metal-associated domain-containing protein [Alphaproteobacteria bacterium]MDE2112903.1 heavy-metal-associated domain-containing protein [Alphaproteobacteria bacterium]MDE2494891.1 heavy-metal-associated domain-containing protein [Alphaproteobacteria bacterium]
MNAFSTIIRHICSISIAGTLILIGAAAGFAISPALVTSATAAEQSESAPARYKIVVDGLACPFCAYGIEKKLSAIDGVRTVQTDIASETVTVTMAPGKTLDKATAARAVKDAGFTMHDFEEVHTASSGGNP